MLQPFAGRNCLVKNEPFARVVCCTHQMAQPFQRRNGFVDDESFVTSTGLRIRSIHTAATLSVTALLAHLLYVNLVETPVARTAPKIRRGGVAVIC